MNNEAILEALESMDLSKKEAEVYLALLKLGQSGASRVATTTGINRVTVYNLLDSLKHKGFISSVIKKNTTNFLAKEPKKILDLIKQKEQKISSILPELEAMSCLMGKKSSVVLYEGKRVLELMDEVFSSQEGVLSFGNMNMPEEDYEFATRDLRKRRLQRGVKIRGISNKPPSEVTKTKEWKKLTEMRISKEMEKLTTWVYVFGTKVAIITYHNELMGILIDNEEYANTQRFVFEMMWKQAKKF